MIIPVRCFTCGRVVGSAYDQYKAAVQKGRKSKEALDETGLMRFCCRRMVISHVELIKEAAPFE